MGPGVVQVAQTRTADTGLITATWSDGRFGTVRLIHDTVYGSLLFKAGGHTDVDPNLQGPGYAPLVKAIVAFARTGRSPVPEAETLEIFRVMDAARQSLEQGGAQIKAISPAANH